jgi:hypothetical protein
MDLKPFPDHGDSRYFNLEGYRAILTRALSQGYSITPFREFATVDHRPLILLRHDLDHTLSRVTLVAEIEAALGVRATYFVQTSCEFYNLLSQAGRELLRSLTDLGHEIGLHYVAADYVQTGRDVENDIRLLEDLSGQRVRSASQHVPIDGEEFSLPKVIENEAYEARFIDSPMTYISDSLMAWRQATPHDLIDSRASFQFLMHPEVWCGNGSNMADVLTHLHQEEVSRLKAAYDGLQVYYRQLLAERLERDRRFKERKARRIEHVQNERS